ncbi:MAG: hypothetical protein R6U51_07760 [Anaerolineales bacterium]
MLTRIFSKIKRELIRFCLLKRVRRTNRKILAHSQPDTEKKPVIFFNASARLRGLSQNAAFSLITAWAVQLAGVPVVHFACRAGMSHCVLGTILGDPDDPPPCRGCVADTRRFTESAFTAWFDYHENQELKSKLDGLCVSELKDFHYQDRPLGPLAVPSLRWALRRHDLKDDQITRYLLSSYIISAHNIAENFRQVLQREQPQSVIVFNGLQYPEATVRWVAQQHGSRVITFEVGLRPYSAFFTDGDATAYPIHFPDAFQLSEEQNERLDAYLENRFEGNFTMAGIQFWPEMRSLDDEIIKKIGEYKQVIPIFTNVVFDTSQAFANTIFSSMFDWLDTLSGIIKDHPESLFVIRAHPDELREGKESKQTVEAWVKSNRLDERDNVIFIGPNQLLSSYELIRRSKFVMVYNSSIGLEASLLGAPVLCGGKARYTQYPIVFYPDSKKDYLQKASNLLESTQIEVPEEFSENARRFLYYQLFKVSLPFDEYLITHPAPSYVQLEKFPIKKLKPEKSPTIKTLLKGILHGEPFVLDGKPKEF